MEYVKRRLDSKMVDRFKNSSTKVVVESHEDYVRVHAGYMFNNIVQRFFTKAFVNQSPCERCGKRGRNERCHPEDAPRGYILLQALRVVSPVEGPDAVPVFERDIILEFLRLHGTHNIVRMCHDCHVGSAVN